MTIDIDRLSEAELIELNNRIVLRLRFLDEMRAHSVMMQFKIGNRVSFDPPNRPTVTGVIAKYNRKSVTVVSDQGQQWTVAPSLLRKAEIDITSPDGAQNVVPIGRN